MAEKLDWFDNKRMVTHPDDPTVVDRDRSYREQLEAGIYTPPQTPDDLSVLSDILIEQNQKTDSSGKTLEENIQSLKDADTQAALDAAAEQDTLAKIAEEQAELASENLQYLVRGAVLRCRFGTHQRRLNLPECHGVYTQSHPMVHQLDCISGGPFSNIEAFGICSAEGNPSGEKILLKKEILDENGLAVSTSGDNEKGKPCAPIIIGTWMGANETAFIRENMAGAGHSEEPDADGSYHATLTTRSFLVCKYGGLIEPRTSGQEYDSKQEIADKQRYEDILAMKESGKTVNDLSTEDKQFLVDYYEAKNPSEAEKMNRFLSPLSQSKNEDTLNIKFITYTGKDEYKKVLFDRLVSVKMVPHEHSGQFALPLVDIIAVNLVDDGAKDPRGPYYVLFHELGHQVDYGLMQGTFNKDTYSLALEALKNALPQIPGAVTSGVGNILKNPIALAYGASIDPARQQNIESSRSDVYRNINDKIEEITTGKDIDVVQKKTIFNSILTNDTTSLTDKENTIKEAVLQEYKNSLLIGGSSAKNAGVTDVYGGYTNNTLRLGSYGHDQEYWDWLGMLVDVPYLELFADNFASNITGYESHLTKLNEYFPSSSIQMNDVIISAAGGIK